MQIRVERLHAGGPGESVFTSIMEERYHFPAGTARMHLEDGEQHVLGAFDQSSALLGFIIFSRYDKVLRSSEYIYLMRTAASIAAAPGVKAWAFDALWFDRERVQIEEALLPIVDAAEAHLKEAAPFYAIVQFGYAGEDWDRFRERLMARGFKRVESEYIYGSTDISEFPVPDQAPPYPEQEGVSIQAMAEVKPDFESMAQCYNSIFTGGKGGITAEALSRLADSDHFSSALSLMALDGQKGNRVAGFCMTNNAGVGRIEVTLVGLLPEYRRQGHAIQCVPAFLAQSRMRGIDEIRFSVSSTNERALKLLANAVKYREIYRRIILYKASRRRDDKTGGREAGE